MLSKKIFKHCLKLFNRNQSIEKNSLWTSNDFNFRTIQNLMFNDRVLRGNTYAILKNVNRNIDPNIKPPMIKKNIKI